VRSTQAQFALSRIASACGSARALARAACPIASRCAWTPGLASHRNAIHDAARAGAFSREEDQMREGVLDYDGLAAARVIL